MNVSKLFNMVHEASSDTAAIRAVFVIDPERRLRAMIYYPLDVGRNMPEVLRLVDALQTGDKHKVACPANWNPGDPVIVPPPKTYGEAVERLTRTDIEVTDWYFSKTNL